ncbi:MAG TPA: class I SAM-dependent methyltransferase [Candidatus Limnocylindrales bacterium]|nr:class I SAM-dependent methyltransferase [Candidatus Limnocylindrales bacterium]
MDKVDYDRFQHTVFARGRAIAPDVLVDWISAFARYAGPARPQTVLDLGSGIGRFTPALADEFGGPVYGVEPSIRMREIAQESASHPNVTYLDGRAERIPLPDNSCDVALLYLVLHHIAGRDEAALELARVLKRGGKLFVRTTFVELTPDLLWYSYFPGAKVIEERHFPTVAEVERTFAPAGFSVVELACVRHRIADSLAEYTARLKLRALSTFEHMTEEEIAEGFARMDADVAAETAPRPVAEDCHMLVFTKD